MDSQLEIAFIQPEETKRGHGLTGMLGKLEEDTLVLISGEEQANTIAPYAQLTERSDYREKRTRSICQVRFGDLEMHNDYTTDSTLSVQPVALKPLPKPWMAAREYRTAEKLNNKRRLTFKPLGFLALRGGKIATVTEFEQGVTSFDNILYRKDGQPPQHEVEWALRCAADTLLILHDKGYAHGDYQVKNTAHDVTLQPRVIDLTTIRKRDDPAKFGEDLTLYMESLSRFGVLESPASADQVKDLFLDPYYQAIHDIFPSSKQKDMQKILADLAVNADAVMNRGSS